MKVLITGASRGIGRALCEEGLKRGHEVYAVVREASRAPRGTAPVILSDVRNREATTELLKTLAPQIDLLIANAGVGFEIDPKSENAAEQAAEIIDVNASAVIFSSYRIANEWIRLGCKDRRVALISSLAAGRGFPRMSVYSASKAALVSFAQGFEFDLARYGIGVSVICPGFIDTDMTRDNPFRPFLVPLKRCAELTWNGLEKKKFMIAYPWPTALLSWWRDRIPYFLFRWMIKVLFPQKS